MSVIDEEIVRHCRNSKRLKELFIGEHNLKYDKTIELQKLQDEEYKKMMFLKNLKKEIDKNDRKH